MTALAPILEAFFTDRLMTQRDAWPCQPQVGSGIWPLSRDGYGSGWLVPGGEQDAFAEQRQPGAAEHLPFDHLDVVDASFDGAGVPVGGQALGDGVEVLLEALGEG